MNAATPPAAVPLTNAEVWDIVQNTRSKFRDLMQSAPSYVPHTSVLLEEVKVLQYLQHEGAAAKASIDVEPNTMAVTPVIQRLESLKSVRLTGPEIFQLVNLRATSECEVYTVLGDLDMRAVSAETAVAEIIDCLRPLATVQ